MPEKTSTPSQPSLPTPPTDTVNDLRTDKENAFLLYAVFCGDVNRTAHALNVSPVLVETLAKEGKWDAKLAPIIELKKSTKAGDVERAVNRALNFVQAHKTRMFFERVLSKLCGMTPSELEAFIMPKEFKRGTDGAIIEQRFTTRALADMASALEKCHLMTYLALNDTATERKERKNEGEDDATAAELHLRLADAMAQSGAGLKSPAGLVAEAQLVIAQESAVVELEKPKS